jgi:hypothetical protein
MGHPKTAAIAAAASVSVCMGMKQDLWKLIARLVAKAKSSKTCLRQVAASTEALPRMRVSSRIGGEGTGCRGIVGGQGIRSPKLYE